jgi:hypothetical protein
MEIGDIASMASSTILGLFALGSTIYYSRAAKKRADDLMMKDLFTDFNKRYDALNDDILLIVNSAKADKTFELKPCQKKTIIDFFNLCSEEYFWFKRGRIDNKIWLSWSSGMNYWYQHDVINKLWKEEVRSRNGKLSYYIENGDEFFKEIN